MNLGNYYDAVMGEALELQKEAANDTKSNLIRGGGAAAGAAGGYFGGRALSRHLGGKLNTRMMAAAAKHPGMVEKLVGKGPSGKLRALRLGAGALGGGLGLLGAHQAVKE